ncbi:hypothetical protein ERJ77_29220, partial [Vibrio anguillarum]|nr:hypothetical protein [Vibrio anguillarum]
MNEQINAYFRFLVESEIPSLYSLIELFFMVYGAVLFFWGIGRMRGVRALTGVYSQMHYAAADVGINDVFLKVFSGVFLMSFGAGQALVANSIYITQNFQPYSVEVFRSISCASGSVQGCLHYDLGLYQDG